jgi:hypothetical protein
MAWLWNSVGTPEQKAYRLLLAQVHSGITAAILGLDDIPTSVTLTTKAKMRIQNHRVSIVDSQLRRAVVLLTAESVTKQIWDRRNGDLQTLSKVTWEDLKQSLSVASWSHR